MPEIFEVTVRSGEDICKTISDFVTAHGWQNVMIPAAIGSVIGMEFTAPIRDELPLRCAVTPYHAAAESCGGQVFFEVEILFFQILKRRGQQCKTDITHSIRTGQGIKGLVHTL